MPNDAVNFPMVFKVYYAADRINIVRRIFQYVNSMIYI
ncbi:hypothetical protein IMSAGC014_00403 [Bacteroidaceae bacterium]|nr:hypothetical protein IMSAGC014_00403 [Bacteroidaceae bacterium]